MDITKAARKVNENQVEETLDFILKLCENKLFPKITVMGIAFKGVPETDDLRGSMALKIISLLTTKLPSAKLKLYDFVVDADTLKGLGLPVAKNIEDALTKADLVIISNNHPGFKKISLQKIHQLINKDGFIYDYWNNFSHESNQDKKKFNYISLGNHKVFNEKK